MPVEAKTQSNIAGTAAGGTCRKLFDSAATRAAAIGTASVADIFLGRREG